MSPLIRLNFGPSEAPNEVTWARGRLPDRTYIHATFTLDLPASQDYGQPARYVVKVFDEPNPPLDEKQYPELDYTEEVVHTTPAGRKQIKLQIAREAGLVRKIQIQRVPTGDTTKLENLLTLDREASSRLIELIQTLQYIPVDGGEPTLRLDDQTIQDFFRDPDAVLGAYRRNPETFRSIIKNDPSAEDLVAIAHRRQVVAHFRQLLDDAEYFEAQRLSLGADVGKEGVWQALLEAEPWILGVTLSGQLLTSWDTTRLEQVVSGFSVGGPAKRTDALMQTNGQIRSLVFAEIKHHDTALITNEQYKSGAEYRPGCWPPSVELAGGVTQLQQTVLLAREQLGEALEKLDDAGAETGEKAFIVRPRSYLIIGHLRKLRGLSGVHRAKYRSFELYRRNLYEPDVITFDELLARAEWHVQAVEADVVGQ